LRREAATALYALLELGTISILPIELKKLKAKFDKKQLTKHQVENLIMTLALKFTNVKSNEESSADELGTELPIEITQKPEIIISETFH
jgi:hypothetical protein